MALIVAPDLTRSSSGVGQAVELGARPSGPVTDVRPLGRRARRRGAFTKRKQWQGGGARTGPGRKGREACPPRKNVGAGERSPSAPLLRHQLSKSAGAKRRVMSPVSLIPPASSHSEG